MGLFKKRSERLPAGAKWDVKFALDKDKDDVGVMTATFADAETVYVMFTKRVKFSSDRDLIDFATEALAQADMSKGKDSMKKKAEKRVRELLNGID